MTTDGERDGPGEGASPGEREPVPEFVEHTPIGDDADAETIDLEFAKIIADWDTSPVRPAGDDGLAAPGHRIVREPRDSPLPQRPQLWRGFIPPEEEAAPARPGDQPEATDSVDRALPAPAERYVPPEPPPIGGDLVSRLSWAAVLGGPVFLLFAVLFWANLPHILMILALAAFVGGFVALVVRMPRDRDPDDNDDGAVL